MYKKQQANAKKSRATNIKRERVSIFLYVKYKFCFFFFFYFAPDYE